MAESPQYGEDFLAGRILIFCYNVALSNKLIEIFCGIFPVFLHDCHYYLICSFGKNLADIINMNLIHIGKRRIHYQWINLTKLHLIIIKNEQWIAGYNMRDVTAFTVG